MKQLERFQLAIKTLKDNLASLEASPKDFACLELIKVIKIYIACFEEAVSKNDTNNPTLLALIDQILNVLNEHTDE